MKRFLCVFGVVGACLLGNAANAVSAGSVGVADAARGVNVPTTGMVMGANVTPTQLRGNAGAMNAYKQNQRNFIISQPDVDTACRRKIFECFTEYCGDTVIVPGQRESRCMYATESELYNYALLCLQRDMDVLLPQYGSTTNGAIGGMNTAARLCPSYVQQELMSYLSMANMANELSKSHSDLCIRRRQELEAAMACHSIALSYGNETSSMLTTQLTDACGAGVPGGDAEMVSRFANAGNMGANIWGWAEKIVSLDMNKKGADWQSAVDAVLTSYVNRMNLACGDNFQLNLPARSSNGSDGLEAIRAVASIALTGQDVTANQKVPNPYENQSIWQEYTARAELYTYNDAFQAVMAAFSHLPLHQNDWWSSSQMDDMQQAYIRGTKVFIVRDSARCYVIPIAELSDGEMSAIAQTFGYCVSR